MNNQILKNLNNAEKPYERFEKYGANALTDAELLAIIIRSGNKERDALSIAKDILRLCGDYGINGLNHLSFEDLQTIQGLGPVKATQIKCLAEMNQRMIQTKMRLKDQFLTPEEIVSSYRERLRHNEKEICVVLCLDQAMHFIKDIIISTGTINNTLISAREIFIEALKHKAVNIILLHNHPSGNVTPSKADIDATKRLYEASKIIGIELKDHIIIGDMNYYSFCEHNFFNLQNLKGDNI